MATGIPLPGQPGEELLKGLTTGSNMFSQMIQPRIQREQMGQQWQQHLQNLALQQQQEARMQQMLPFQIQQYEHQAMMSPYQQQLMQAQAQQAQGQVKDLAFNRDLMEKLMSGQGFGQQMPQQSPMAMEANGPWSQQGAPSMAPQSPQNPQNGGFQNIDPMAAAMIKKRTGLDLLAESPNMKSQRALQDFIIKEQYKQNVPKEQLTPTVVSQTQEEIFNIQKIKPELDKLIEMEPQAVTFWQTTKDKDFDALTFKIADGLVKAKRLPQTNDSIHKMQDTLRIGKSEKPADWKKRMERERDDLDEREEKGLQLLSGKQIRSSGGENASQKLRGVDAQGNQWEINPSDKEAFVRHGGKLL